MGRRSEPGPDELLLLNGCDDVALRVVHARSVARTRSILPFQALAILGLVVFWLLNQSDVGWLRCDYGDRVVLGIFGLCAIVYALVAPSFLRNRVTRDAEEAMNELRSVTRAASGLDPRRIEIIGSPVEHCAVLGAISLEAPSRWKHLPVWGPVLNAGPLIWVLSLPLFLVVLVVIRVYLGADVAAVVALAGVAAWVMNEHLRPRYMFLDNRHLRLVEENWLGRENEVVEVPLPECEVRVDWRRKSLKIDVPELGEVHVALNEYLRPFKLVGGLVANALPESATFELASVGNWARVSEVTGLKLPVDGG